jgi:hypothetical protein
LSEEQIFHLVGHWRGFENATTIELKREIFIYIRDKAKKGKTEADEKKDWIPKLEREERTLKRRKEKMAKASASGAGAAPPSPRSPSPRSPVEKGKPGRKKAKKDSKEEKESPGKRPPKKKIGKNTG